MNQFTNILRKTIILSTNGLLIVEVCEPFSRSLPMSKIPKIVSGVSMKLVLQFYSFRISR